MNERKASCSCGQLNLTVTGDPIRISICHCLACQRRTGSIFAVQARFPTADVQIRGEAKTWSRIGDEGGRAVFYFCATCAAIVYWIPDAQPEVTYVPVGAFADPTFPPPKVAVYEARRHPWAVMPALEVDHFD